MSNNPEKKGVSAIDFFCIGFGAIVGVGWAVAINGWMTSCGGRDWLHRGAGHDDPHCSLLL